MKILKYGNNETLITMPDDRELFFSYETLVAGFVPGIGHVRTSTRYSKTTTKHINKYLAGLVYMTVSQQGLEELLK